MSIENLIKKRQLEIIEKTAEDGSVKDLQVAGTRLNEGKPGLLKAIRERLIESYSIEEINSKEKFNAIRKAAWSMIEDEAEKDSLRVYLDSYDKAEIFELLIQTMFGYGIFDSLFNDPSITDIMVNGLQKIFVERNGVIEQPLNKRGEALKFHSIEELMYVIEKVVAPVNRKVDESNPMVDARLPNGFRVNIVLSPISLDGPVITVRKFPEQPYAMEQLMEFGMLPAFVADFLEKLVRARYNIIVSGGTGSGKTTFLNALSQFIDKDMRIITIEDAAELKLINLTNLVRLETRPPNIEGKGEITMRDLVRTALRMRPDIIIVGEVRGGEALDMLQAMNTGHDGSLSTGHANSALDMLSRLETMVLMAGMELPLASIRQQIASAVDFIVHLSKLQNGARKVMQVTEILGADSEGYVTQDIFEFRKYNDTRGGIGELVYTGNPVKGVNKLLFANIDPTIFKMHDQTNNY